MNAARQEFAVGSVGLPKAEVQASVFQANYPGLRIRSHADYVTAANLGDAIFGTLLSWLQDKRADVFVVATANDVSKLPPELLRKGRFDEIFFVDLPDRAARAEVLRIHLGRAGHKLDKVPGTVMESLVQRTRGFTGAEIEAAVQAGLIDAFTSGHPVTDGAVATYLQSAVSATVPLSKTMAERIATLRDFCKTGRAVPAGATLEDDEAKIPAQAAEVEL